MILLAFELDDEIARPDDARDHPDPVTLFLEVGALLDVRFEVRDVPFGIEALGHDTLETGRVECIAQGLAGFVGRAERMRRRVVHERETSEAAVEPAFLVKPGCDVDCAILRRRRLGQRPGDLQPVDHAHRAVEPAPGRLGVGVGADDDRLAGVAGSADHVAGAVDAGIQSRLLQSATEPAPGIEIDRRERGPHHPGPASPELAQTSQIRD